ncbi:hypothetical protein ACJJTC_002947 [Scirpophaga incertulas]
MVSTSNFDEKFNRVRRNFCFYLDIQDNGISRYLSRRIQDMGLQQEWCLSSRVTHVVRAAAAAPDAMLRGRRGPAEPTQKYVHLTVQKAISLLDKLYDTFFKAPRKAHVRFFTKHFIKIEFLDKVCRPVYKEFDEWPQVSIDPDPPKEKKEPQENPPTADQQNTPGQKMTRKSRPRFKDREDKEQKGGYCEMCNAEYADNAAHLRSPHHAAFVKDHHNFLALDSLIGAGADVETFLTKANGERPSRPKRVYQVLGVAKLRSSGGLPIPTPATNGHDPLVVKFRKVRRSELSVLSDEAEQFMFPKRASSTSSTSSSEEEPLPKPPSPKRRSPAQAPPAPPPPERRRLARPIALKEESSEEDSWVEDKKRRKRRVIPVAKKGRRKRVSTVDSKNNKEIEPTPEPPPAAKSNPVVSPLREETAQKCMKWEDGKLKYTPAVEQLQFAFESVPASEPWFETFRRQDQDKVIVRNIPQYFELYSSKAPPKLPYEIGQLPPLKPNCCPLSDLVTKKEDKSGPSRSYGTRGMKKQRIRKRTAALLALEGQPRKSPREHASTLAILGSAGLLHRRKHAEDSKSTASEDTISDTQSNAKVEPVVSETQAASERLNQFLTEVFEEAAEFDLSDEGIDGDMPLITSTNIPDVSSLVSECDKCDIIHNEIKAEASVRSHGRRGRFKKKNRTGWPNKKKHNKKNSRNNSLESDHKDVSSVDRSSAEPMDEDTLQSTVSEDDGLSGNEKTIVDMKSEDESHHNEETLTANETETEPDSMEVDESQDTKESSEEKDEKRTSRSSTSDAEDREIRKKRRALQGLLLQPVVRVARVDPLASARTLRSRRR